MQSVAKSTKTVLELVQRLFEQETELTKFRKETARLQDRIDLAMRECPVCKRKVGAYTLCPQRTILQLGMTVEEHNSRYEEER
jgi:hypothetical protein